MVNYENKFCKLCNKEFTPKNKNQKFCSSYCQSRGYEKVCELCGKTFFGRRDKVYCSKECQKDALPLMREKMEKTLMSRYGVKHALQNKDFLNKAKNTMMGRYGSYTYTKTDEYKEKYKKTCLEKYGVDNHTKAVSVKEKAKDTNRKKYGSDYFTQTGEYKEKVKKTNLKKYGVEWYLQSDDKRKKTEETNLEKYGAKHFTQSKFFDNKFSKMETNPNYVHMVNLENFNEFYVRENFIKDEEFLMEEFCSYFNIKSLSNGYLIKKRFGITYPNKFKKYHTQKEIQDFVKSIYKGEIIFNRKITLGDLELDLVIPDKKLAIEFDGIYFHSYGKHKTFEAFDNHDEEDSNYHLNKTILCESKDIHLLHIFENEWIDTNKKEIWKSIIRNKLGVIENKINARDCEIKEVSNFDSEVFLDENHLQGKVSSFIRLGLYYNGELVSLFTVGKSRFNKNYEFELLRFCNKINTIVNGAFNKLLKYFKNNYNDKSLLTYGNRRWVSSLNNVYSKNGKYIGTTKPNYFYFKHRSYELESRLKYQKHKLKDILENFDEKLTESENMYNNGYRKIYDCGNLVYEL